MPETQILQINGIDLHVTTAGDPAARPVLLLHGLTANAGFEASEIAELAKQHRVIAPDLRGHGRTTRPSSYHLRDHVEDMFALLDALQIEQTAVMGTSMGSYVAQALAIRQPRRVDKLILVVSKSHGTTSSTARYLAEHADEVKDLTPAQQQLWLGQRMFAPETDPTIPEQAFGWMIEEARAGRALTPEQVEAANAALANFDFRGELPTLKTATLILSGRHDILNPPEDGEELHSLIENSRFEVFEHSGHMLTLEEPERLGRFTRAFLAD